MMTRDVVIRLAAAAFLLIAIGAAGNVRPAQRSQFREAPKPQADWLQHEWMRFCAPFSSEICADKSL